MTQTKLFVPSNVCSLRSFLAIVGTAESSSEHPIGVAIAQNSKEILETSGLGHCLDFEAVPGHGLQCIVSSIKNLIEGESIDLKPLDGNDDDTYQVSYNFPIDDIILVLI